MKLRMGLTPEWVDGAAEGVKYKLRPLTGAQRLELSQQIWAVGRSSSVPAEAQFDAVRASLVDWSGVEDEDGNPVSFDPELIEYLDDAEIVTIFSRVYELSTVGIKGEDSEGGNSESQ